jgi:hypothetical protein
MVDVPWEGDACSLVDAFRAGERSPLEELDATLKAIEASDLNAFSFVDPERARDTARRADVTLPFGGVPTGIKELETVTGWPATEASLVFRHRIGSTTSTLVERLLTGGGAAGRSHDRERVRRPERRHDEAQRRHPQPVASRSLARRVVGRKRGRGRRRPGFAGDRW